MLVSCTRNAPFAGWAALVVLIAGEAYPDMQRCGHKHLHPKGAAGTFLACCRALQLPVGELMTSALGTGAARARPQAVAQLEWLIAGELSRDAAVRYI